MILRPECSFPGRRRRKKRRRNPRAELVRRLLEYKMYKFMARELEDMEEDAERLLFKAPTIPREVAEYEAPVDLDELLKGLTLAKLQEIFAVCDQAWGE